MIDELDLFILTEDEYDNKFGTVEMDDIEGMPTIKAIRHSSRLMATKCIPASSEAKEKRRLQVLFSISIRHRCESPIPLDWINEYISADNNRKHWAQSSTEMYCFYFFICYNYIIREVLGIVLWMKMST